MVSLHTSFIQNYQFQQKKDQVIYIGICTVLLIAKIVAIYAFLVYKIVAWKSSCLDFVDNFYVWVQWYTDIDLQQVYLLQSEAHKDKTLTFICEYFRHHGRIKHWHWHWVVNWQL